MKNPITRAFNKWLHHRKGVNPAPVEPSLDEARHDAVKAIHDIMTAVPCSSLYSLAEAVHDAGYSLAPDPLPGQVAGLRKAAEWHMQQCEAFDRQMRSDEVAYNRGLYNKLPDHRIEALMRRWQSSSCNAANHRDYAAELNRQADALLGT